MNRSTIFSMLLLLAVGVSEADGADSLRIRKISSFSNAWGLAARLDVSGDHVFVASGETGLWMLCSGYRPAGDYSHTFDAAGLATGSYYLRLETSDRALTRRVTLIK